MALLDKLFGKTETETTIETEVKPVKQKASKVNSDLALETAITGKTEAVIKSED